MNSSWKNSVDRFCAEYLQLEHKPELPPGNYLKLAEVQSAIFEKLFAEDAVKYGPPIRYQVRMLKLLISTIEASIDDWDEYAVSDELISALSPLLIAPLPTETEAVQQKCYVTYSLSQLEASPNSHITLFENRSLISAAGTTGLRTWEAALHLGQYLCTNPALVAEKRVLELGAGTGYLSILCAKHLHARHVLATDGSDEVINNLPDNLFLNSLQGSAEIRAMELKWGYALMGTEDDKWNGGQPIDVVIGADITYDKSVIPSLIGTVEELFALYPTVDVYISATQRNLATLQVFLDKCQSRGLVVQSLQYPLTARSQQAGPFYNDDVAISIYKVSEA